MKESIEWGDTQEGCKSTTLVSTDIFKTDKDSDPMVGS